MFPKSPVLSEHWNCGSKICFMNFFCLYGLVVVSYFCYTKLLTLRGKFITFALCYGYSHQHDKFYWHWEKKNNLPMKSYFKKMGFQLCGKTQFSFCRETSVSFHNWSFQRNYHVYIFYLTEYWTIYHWDSIFCVIWKEESETHVDQSRTSSTFNKFPLIWLLSWVILVEGSYKFGWVTIKTVYQFTQFYINPLFSLDCPWTGWV